MDYKNNNSFNPSMFWKLIRQWRENVVQNAQRWNWIFETRITDFTETPHQNEIDTFGKSFQKNVPSGSLCLNFSLYCGTKRALIMKLISSLSPLSASSLERGERRWERGSEDAEVLKKIMWWLTSNDLTNNPESDIVKPFLFDVADFIQTTSK